MNQYTRMLLFYLLILTLDLTAYSIEKKSILIVVSYHEEYEWVQSFERGFNTVFSEYHELHWFYMDTKRLSPDTFDAITDRAWNMYSKLKPVIVILHDDNALKLLGPRLYSRGILRY